MAIENKFKIIIKWNFLKKEKENLERSNIDSDDFKALALELLAETANLKLEKETLTAANNNFKSVLEKIHRDIFEFKEKIQQKCLEECKKLQIQHKSVFEAFKNESFKKLADKDNLLEKLKQCQTITVID